MKRLRCLFAMAVFPFAYPFMLFLVLTAPEKFAHKVSNYWYNMTS